MRKQREKRENTSIKLHTDILLIFCRASWADLLRWWSKASVKDEDRGEGGGSRVGGVGVGVDGRVRREGIGRRRTLTRPPPSFCVYRDHQPPGDRETERNRLLLQRNNRLHCDSHFHSLTFKPMIQSGWTINLNLQKKYKNLATQNASRYSGNDTIYCDTFGTTIDKRATKHHRPPPSLLHPSISSGFLPSSSSSSSQLHL